MSHRPIEHKHRRRAAKAFRTTLPRYFDLVQWLLDHGHAKTKRQARQLILDEKVTSDSHTLGIIRDQIVPKMTPFGVVDGVEVKNVVDPRVAVDLRDGIVVA